MKEEDVSRGGIGLTSEENVILEKKTSSSQTQEPTEDNLDDLDGTGLFKAMINGES